MVSSLHSDKDTIYCRVLCAVGVKGTILLVHGGKEKTRLSIILVLTLNVIKAESVFSWLQRTKARQI